MRVAQDSRQKTQAGIFVNLRETPAGNLDIVLTRRGREDFAEINAFRKQYGNRVAFKALLRDHLERGWELVPGPELGALTSGPILSREIERDIFGAVLFAGRIYWYADYSLLDEIEELRRHGFLEFRGAP